MAITIAPLSQEIFDTALWIIYPCQGPLRTYLCATSPLELDNHIENPCSGIMTIHFESGPHILSTQMMLGV